MPGTTAIFASNSGCSDSDIVPDLVWANLALPSESGATATGSVLSGLGDRRQDSASARVPASRNMSRARKSSPVPSVSGKRNAVPGNRVIRESADPFQAAVALPVRLPVRTEETCARTKLTVWRFTPLLRAAAPSLIPAATSRSIPACNTSRFSPLRERRKLSSLLLLICRQDLTLAASW